MKKVLLPVLSAAVIFMSAPIFAQDEQKPEADVTSAIGVWKTIDDETKEEKSYVQIYEENGKVYGKVIKLIKKPGAICDKCDGTVFPKDTPVMGMRMLWDMEKKDKEYAGGKIFDPEKNKAYTCRIWREGNILKVRGYLGPFFRTQTWHWVGDK